MLQTLFKIVLSVTTSAQGGSWRPAAQCHVQRPGQCVEFTECVEFTVKRPAPYSAAACFCKVIQLLPPDEVLIDFALHPRNTQCVTLPWIIVYTKWQQHFCKSTFAGIAKTRSVWQNGACCWQVRVSESTWSFRFGCFFFRSSPSLPFMCSLRMIIAWHRWQQSSFQVDNKYLYMFCWTPHHQEVAQSASCNPQTLIPQHWGWDGQSIPIAAVPLLHGNDLSRSTVDSVDLWRSFWVPKCQQVSSWVKLSQGVSKPPTHSVRPGDALSDASRCSASGGDPTATRPNCNAAHATWRCDVRCRLRPWCSPEGGNQGVDIQGIGFSWGFWGFSSLMSLLQRLVTWREFAERKTVWQNAEPSHGQRSSESRVSQGTVALHLNS